MLIRPLSLLPCLLITYITATTIRIMLLLLPMAMVRLQRISLLTKTDKMTKNTFVTKILIFDDI